LIRLGRPSIGIAERRSVMRVLRSGNLAQGAEVDSFEREFSSVVVSDHPVVAVNSGTSGLVLGLIAAGVGPGNEVVVPSFTFAATPNAVALTGAKPVFCDIEADTFSLSPTMLEAVITPRTVGVMPVHMFGHPARMPEILSIAASHGLKVFEDAAQAHGADIDGKKVGTFGEFGVFSLYPTKNMTSGEGGMVSYSSPELGRKIRLLRNQGMEVRYQNELVGFNMRMSDVHAAIGRPQLKKLERWTNIRRANADFLSRGIAGLETPLEVEGYRHVYHQYTLRIPEERDRFSSALATEYGIESGIYYPVPTHRLPAFARTSEGLHLPESDRASQEVLSIPVHPQLRLRDLERVATAINRLSRAGA
jgi:perosamine synthetase